MRKGTLSPEEREIMEHHVVTTEKILSQIEFGQEYDRVVKYAAEHHEFLNGTGYPKQLKEEELSLGTRLLTIMDIYDSLISVDRPYKKAMPVEHAFLILEEMAEEGELDMKIIQIWKESIC